MGVVGFCCCCYTFSYYRGNKKKKMTSHTSFKKKPQPKLKNNHEEATIIPFHMMNASAEQSWKPAIQAFCLDEKDIFCHCPERRWENTPELGVVSSSFKKCSFFGFSRTLTQN